MRRAFLAACAVLLAAGDATAQDAQPVTVTPGSAQVVGSALHPESRIFDWQVIQGTDTLRVAQLTDELVRDTLHGSEVWRRVITLERAGGGTLVDSTWSSLATLAPVRHRSHQPQRVIRYDFTADSVRGTITHTDSSATDLAQALATPLFDSGNWELVARALPLEAGRTFELGMYDPDRGGDVRYQATVHGAEAVPIDTAMTAWRVDVTLGQQRARVWVDPETRALRYAEIDLAPGATLQQLPR